MNRSLNMYLYFAWYNADMTRSRRRRKYRRVKRRTPVFGRLLVLVIGVSFLVFGMRWIRSTLRLREELQEESRLEAENPLRLHAYDWDNLSENGEFLTYEDQTYTSLKGIDVSAFQDEIDWEKVKQSGIDFAYIRAGYRGYDKGHIKVDPRYEYNIEQAKKAGLDVGIYFFSQAITAEEAREEAEYMIRIQGKYDLRFPIVFDMEHNSTGIDRIGHLSREEKTEFALTFCRHVQKAGYIPMIYASSGLFDTEFDLKYFADMHLWVAEYGSYPSFPYEFSMWQYSCTGKVDGISGNVDLDLMPVKK